MEALQRRGHGGDHVALWGADHPELGTMQAVALDDRTAVAISAGKVPKPYPHLDANEDAVLAAAGPVGTLLAVADGHSGFDAAQAAVEGVAEQLGLLKGSSHGRPEDVLQALLGAAQQRVRDALAGADAERRRSRTALSLALLSGHDLVVAGWGDTQVLRLRGPRVRAVGPDGPFLDPSSATPKPVRVRLRDGDVVLACSDGLRDYLPGDWSMAARLVAASPDAVSAARALVRAAWDGGAGDHVSVSLTQWAG